MGIATVNFTIVKNSAGWPSNDVMTSITAGGRTFEGYVSNANLIQIPNTFWYETRITLVSLTT
jgi:hypothetical protein